MPRKEPVDLYHLHKRVQRLEKMLSLPGRESAKVDDALLLAHAVLDNIHYWNPDFIKEVKAKVFYAAMSRGLRPYFEKDNIRGLRVRLNWETQPVKSDDDKRGKRAS